MEFASSHIYSPACVASADTPEEVAAAALSAASVVEIDEEDLSYGLDAYSVADGAVDPARNEITNTGTHADTNETHHLHTHNSHTHT
jgi:hypothetical protein